MLSLADLPAKDRLIVALDVKGVEAALRAVALLPNVSFFKIGYELFVTGNVPALLRELRGKRLFFDLKVPADISNTIAAVIDQCIEYQVTFLTLSDSMPPSIIRDARASRDRRQAEYPKLLTVPLISRLDETDFTDRAGKQDLETYILSRAHEAVSAGCEGIIASGRKAIEVCRQAFPHPILIVSPGIRPLGASTDDHKRLTTPAEAIEFGADCLVVGRPILADPQPGEAADRIIEEMEAASRLRAGRR
jgi:orotidine-5'-phosphate decarboxylase